MNQLAVQTPALATDQLENSEPQQVFLFSGHMVDAPERSQARFPPEREPFAAAAIGKLLDELGACADDVAICCGACGGDLLFAEACLKRKVRVEIYLIGKSICGFAPEVGRLREEKPYVLNNSRTAAECYRLSPRPSETRTHAICELIVTDLIRSDRLVESFDAYS